MRGFLANRAMTFVLSGAAAAFLPTHSARALPPTPIAPLSVAATGPESRPLLPPGAAAQLSGSDARKSGAGAGSGFATLVSMAAPLAVIVGVIVVGAAILRKVMGASPGLAAALGAGGPSPSGVVEVLGRYPVARGQQLVLLKVGARVLLLSQGHGGFRARGGGGGFMKLCEIVEPQEVASVLLLCRDSQGESISRRFSALMERFGGDDGGAAEHQTIPAGRLALAGVDGTDRAELWDDRVVAPPCVGQPASALLHGEPRAAGHGDPIATLRARLAAMQNDQEAA